MCPFHSDRVTQSRLDATHHLAFHGLIDHRDLAVAGRRENALRRPFTTAHSPELRVDDYPLDCRDCLLAGGLSVTVPCTPLS